MPQLSQLDSKRTLLLDSSVVINLVATGFSGEILTSLPYKSIVAEKVVSEVGSGSEKSRKNSTALIALIDQGYLEIANLDNAALTHFESLVSGSSSNTLDDGEAATIACAVVTSGAAAAIDERKANRICTERYPQLLVISTVDLLFLPNVKAALGAEKIKVCIENALTHARMRVPQHHLDAIKHMLGAQPLKNFPSLPNSIRKRTDSAVE